MCLNNSAQTKSVKFAFATDRRFIQLAAMARMSIADIFHGKHKREAYDCKGPLCHVASKKLQPEVHSAAKPAYGGAAAVLRIGRQVVTIQLRVQLIEITSIVFMTCLCRVKSMTRGNRTTQRKLLDALQNKDQGEDCQVCIAGHEQDDWECAQRDQSQNGCSLFGVCSL